MNIRTARSEGAWDPPQLLPGDPWSKATYRVVLRATPPRQPFHPKGKENSTLKCTCGFESRRLSGVVCVNPLGDLQPFLR